MIAKIFYALLLIGALWGLWFALSIWEFGRNFRSSDDTRDPACRIHEVNRISFYLKTKGLDLNRMLDSLKNINSQYKLTDFSSMENFDQCVCCCIADDKEIYFNESPKEIYWMTVNRYRFNAGFVGQDYNDVAYVDVVSTYKNGRWHCSVTSKLDSSEKRRIRNRINTEIVSKLPIIKDTCAHKDEF